MTPNIPFLEGRDPDYQNPDLPQGTPTHISPGPLYFGKGDHPLEIRIVHIAGQTKNNDLHTLYKSWENRQNPVVLIALNPKHNNLQTEEIIAKILLPGNEKIIYELPLPAIEKISEITLEKLDSYTAKQFVYEAVKNSTGLHILGLNNMGMFSRNHLENGVPELKEWKKSSENAAAILNKRDYELFEGLGYEIEKLPNTDASILKANKNKKAVAILLTEKESFEGIEPRYDGQTPVSYGLIQAERENLDWLICIRSCQIRLYATSAETNVSGRGRAEAYLEINLELLEEKNAGYLGLLFSSSALEADGTLHRILEDSKNFAVDLGGRLRDRVYFKVVPELAKAVGKKLNIDTGGLPSKADLEHAYLLTLIILFRLLFLAYSEDRKLLPYGTNELYTKRSITEMGKEILKQNAQTSPQHSFDKSSSSYYSEICELWSAVKNGNIDWGVPQYNGGLFDDENYRSTSDGRRVEALADLALTNAEFVPVLRDLLIDEDKGDSGLVDFRSLSVREFGTIYEGLLESRLSFASENLYAKGKVLVSADSMKPKKDQEPDVAKGEFFLSNTSGARKSSGAYFTKSFVVSYILETTLKPALNDHLENRVKPLIQAGKTLEASEALFDFKCADIAMGSGHFLIEAIDIIEKQFVDFLAQDGNSIPKVQEELERLKSAALKNLGEYNTAEIDQTSLLRRLIARRCIYGVDVNRICVELSRLSIWIHTFVPGLPLSFLDHNLICGNSLTGIESWEELENIFTSNVGEKSTSAQTSLISNFLTKKLEVVYPQLKDLVSTVDSNIGDIEKSKQHQRKIDDTLMPLKDLCDIATAKRIQKTNTDLINFTDQDIAQYRELEIAKGACWQLQACHFPVAFPEIFYRDNPGFDCVVGNPPWEKVKVTRDGFWLNISPGLWGYPPEEKELEIKRLELSHPDIKGDYETEIERNELLRNALIKNQYLGIGKGDPDLYVAFAWKFFNLTRNGGKIGIVLPANCLMQATNKEWRKHIFENGEFSNVVLLNNKRGWVFDEIHQQYSIALLNISKASSDEKIFYLRGPYKNKMDFHQEIQSEPAKISYSQIRTWNDQSGIPNFPTQMSVDIFTKIQNNSRQLNKIARSQEPGARSQEPGARSQEPVRDQFASWTQASTEHCSFIPKVRHRAPLNQGQETDDIQFRPKRGLMACI